MINTRKIKHNIKPLAEKHGLSLVLLFGSQATGKTHPRSDFDFGVQGDRRLSPKEIAGLAFEFSSKLKIKDVEVVDLKSATPLLLKQIAEKSLLLYEKEPSFFARFTIYALKRYMEARPLLDLREASLNKFLQKL